MSMPFSALCDDFYTSTRLFLKLGLAPSRETVLHFFDALKREFPTLRKLRRRDDGGLVLEEDANEEGARRWIRLEEGALRFGSYNPPDIRAARRLGERVLELAPFHLTLSELDYDHLEVVYGFDLEYRGNHDQLVADTLWRDHPLSALLGDDTVHHAIDCQPFIGMALTEDCDVQAYVEIKGRTSTFEVRTGRYESQPLTVYLTLRRYFGFGEPESLIESHDRLTSLAQEWAAERVVPLIVNPLAQAIASQP
jgi:hypothetical protein